MAYDARAQEFAYGYYARGWSRDRAVVEIRKTYAGFSRNTWDEWEKKFDWKARRASVEAKLRALEDDLGDVHRSMLLDLEEVRKNLVEQHRNTPGDTQTVYAITAVSKRIGDLAKQHLASRDGDKVSMEILHRAIDSLLDTFARVPEIAQAMKAHANEVGAAVEQVAEHFGGMA
jgi:hypothetical protein